MMKLFTPLAVLALVTASQARVCVHKSDNSFSVQDNCASTHLKREHLISDITGVTVSVWKKPTDASNTDWVPTNGAKISQFSLSNANGESQASGSLDNIDSGEYKVTVEATTDESETFYYHPDQANICPGPAGVVDREGILFQGETAEISISGNGETTAVKVYMEACHTGINYKEDTGYPNIVFPAFFTSVSVTQSAAVLKSEDTAEVRVNLVNGNNNANNIGRGYANTAIGAFITSTDERSGSDKAAWVAVPDQGASTSFTSVDSLTLTENEITIIAGGDKNANDDVFEFQYDTKGAQDTYTTKLTLTPYSYNGKKDFEVLDTTSDSLLAGNPQTFDFIISPVGDLDLEIIYFTGLRIGTQTLGTIESEEFSALSLFKLHSGVFNDEGCDYSPSADDWDYAIPDEGMTSYTTEFEYTDLYELSRTMTFNVIIEEGECSAKVSVIDSGETNVLTGKDGYSKTDRFFGTDLSEPGESISVVVDGVGFQESSSEQVVQLKVDVTPPEYESFSYKTDLAECDIVVKGVTKSTDGKPTAEKNISASFSVKILPKGLYCDRDNYVDTHGESLGSVDTDLFLAQRQCPALRSIMWGSTDHFYKSPACGEGSQQEIKFCSVTPINTPAFRLIDYRLQFFAFTEEGTVEAGSSATFRGISSGATFREFNDDTNDNNEVHDYFTVETTHHNQLDGDDLDSENPCRESQINIGETQRAELDFTAVTFTLKAGVFTNTFEGKKKMASLCEQNSKTTIGARIFIRNTHRKDDNGNDDACAPYAQFKDFESNKRKDMTILCPTAKTVDQNGDNEECDFEDAKRRRNTLSATSSGCPAGPFACPAANSMPFDIKVEDGRLTVSMDTSLIGDKQVVVQTNPVGVAPKRTRFIASDFDEYSKSWTTSLKTKLSSILRDNTMKQNIVPGATASSLIACCGFTPEEAAILEATTSTIVSSEITQLYKPVITIGGGNTGSTGTQQQTTSTQTTSTHTTEKSSDDSSSGGSLLVVVAVAAVLVLVAVIALAIFTVKSNKQSQRVVDLRNGNDKQSSWQKGGAMESDF